MDAKYNTVWEADSRMDDLDTAMALISSGYAQVSSTYARPGYRVAPIFRGCYLLSVIRMGSKNVRVQLANPAVGTTAVLVPVSDFYMKVYPAVDLRAFSRTLKDGDGKALSPVVFSQVTDFDQLYDWLRYVEACNEMADVPSSELMDKAWDKLVTVIKSWGASLEDWDSFQNHYVPFANAS